MIRQFLDAYEQLVADGGGGIQPVTTVTETISGPVATATTVAPEILPAPQIPNIVPVVDIPSNTPVLIQNTADVIPENTPIVVQNKPEVLPYNYVSLLKGFGGYVSDILPDDVATACGAFSTAMRQIRNIQSVPIEKFAQVVTNLETTRGLDLIAGTDVPSDLTLASDGAALVALGSGPDGTYTDSDFFGAMSGLPYPWKDIQTNIGLLQNSLLYSTYEEIYLSAAWEAASVSVQYTSYDVETSPGVYTTYYHVTGVTLVDGGGGYSRGGAPTPTITISGGSGATAVAVIDTEDTNTPSTFGRVTSVSLTSSGTDTTTIPTVTIQCPPTGYTTPGTGGLTNTSAGTTGWPTTMNTVLQQYIDFANTTISNIYNGNINGAKKLNVLWKMVGTQLRIEQRARVTALPPVPVPQDIYLSQFPTSIMAFVDTVPQFSLNTLPHMYAQTLEAISNWKTPGGQSVVGMMRQERNQARLSQVGIELDNNMPGEATPKTTKLLAANGTVSVAEDGAGIQIDNATFTIPASLAQINNNNLIVIPDPLGVYSNELDRIVVPEKSLTSDVLGTLPSLENAPQLIEPGDDEAGFNPIVTTSTGNVSSNSNLINPVTGRIPSGVATPLDTGKPNTTGSLAGSKYQNVIPAPLQVAFTASALTPSTYNVTDAIDEVIKCNCDCWVN